MSEIYDRKLQVIVSWLKFELGDHYIDDFYEERAADLLANLRLVERSVREYSDR